MFIQACGSYDQVFSEKLKTKRNGDLADMLSEILEYTHDGVITIDEEQKIVIFNRGAADIFKYRAEDVLGKSLMILFPESVKSYDNKEENINNLTGGCRSTGEVFPCDITISEICFKGDKYFTAIIRDVSERQKQEDKIKRQESELIKYRIKRKAELLLQVQAEMEHQ